MDTTDRQLTIQNARQKLQKIQDNLIEEVDEKLREMADKLLQEVEQSDVCERHRYVLLDDTNNYKNREKSSKGGVIPEKQFIARNSLLTDLYENKHIQTVYNIFIAILILFFFNIAVHDLVTVGRLNLGIDLIRWNFQGFGSIFCLWLEMFASTLLLFSCFNFWANQRIKYGPSTLSRKLWDCGWLCAFITYEILFLCIPAMIVMKRFVPPALSMALVMEQIRMMMKTYAFVRSNTPRALVYKPHQSGDEKQTSPCPDFSKYLYFLFAPTMVYRDNYPMTREVRWKFVIRCFMEVIGAVFCMAYTFERYLIPMSRNFGLTAHQKTSLSEFIAVAIFGSMLPATLVYLCSFYCLFHSWLNAFSEMLRFADRMFYKDWWNTTSCASYYRLWNIFVHDWLYTYIYKDMSETLQVGRRVSMLTVFLISAVFHEYALTLALRYFYPVLFVTFVSFGACLMSIANGTLPGSNTLLWLLICIGLGFISSLYGFEWYARINCPQVLDPFWDFFVPRSWTCKNI